MPETKRLAWMLLRFIETAFLVGAILCFLIFLFGIYGWFYNIQNLSNLAVSLVSLFLVILLSYLVRKIRKKLGLPATITIDTLKQGLYLILGAVASFGFFYLLTSYFELFPETINSTLLTDILKVLIQTNGFLIGFVGIVFAQMFWAIHNQLCNIQKDILEKPHNPPSEQITDFREDYIEALEKNRKSMILSMLIVVMLILISILLSVSGIAQTEGNISLPAQPYITGPFVFMALGVAAFVVSIAQSEMDVRKEAMQR